MPLEAHHLQGDPIGVKVLGATGLQIVTDKMTEKVRLLLAAVEAAAAVVDQCKVSRSLGAKVIVWEIDGAALDYGNLAGSCSAIAGRRPHQGLRM
mmetsp:Transcript_39002/g.71004  ORF Transcript_39002/g.71004 Transcript_39002/m.71004 type:complete len:95 (-) Transcript_39002:38-322(-)